MGVQEAVGEWSVKRGDEESGKSGAEDGSEYMADASVYIPVEWSPNMGRELENMGEFMGGSAYKGRSLYKGEV